MSSRNLKNEDQKVTPSGTDFRQRAQDWFLRNSIELERDFEVRLSAGRPKNAQRFDLGSEEKSIIVECKSHRWTNKKKVPSAKMTVWNEAMFCLHLAPLRYRKILFVLKDYNTTRKETLAEYYAKTYEHLIPREVTIVEYDEETGEAAIVIGNYAAY